MTDHPITPHELKARGAFYMALSELQSKLNFDSTLEDALRLMPKYGMAWYYADGATVLGHAEGHATKIIESSDSYADDLSLLLGLPSLVDEGSDDQPAALDPSPAAAPVEVVVTDAAAPEPAATPSPEPEPEPEPAPAAPAMVGEDDANLSTAPLSPEDAKSAKSMIAALPVEQQKVFKKAFCDTFAISPQPMRIAGCITEMRHASFVRRFVDEAEGVAAP